MLPCSNFSSILPFLIFNGRQNNSLGDLKGENAKGTLSPAIRHSDRPKIANGSRPAIVADMAPIEEQLIIPTPDKKKIYTTVGYLSGKPKGMVIFVHGLASTELWPSMLLGSWYLRNRGFAYCRINLYHWKPGARSLMTSDLRQHSRDTDTVARYLRKRGHSKLFAVGHSFGGLTLLQAQTSAFRAVSLWDISSFITHPAERFRKDRKSGATYLPGSFELSISKRFQDGMINFPNELDLIAKFRVPTQICYAAGKDAMLVESSKRYFSYLDAPKELVAVPHASHSFTEEGVAKPLFRRTARWFEKHR